MIRKATLFYINSFKGLSKEIWLLSFVTLINRAGTMVIPFIALYLTEDLGFSLTQVGWVMTSFGGGSMIGSWLGGRLSDKFSFYQVMVASLLLTGVAFIVFFQFKNFYSVITAIFLLMIIADAFRPASFAAISMYSKPENRVRSISLIRLAINLGFSAGPAVGGILIYSLGYYSLFIIDGITCIVAGFLIILLLSPKRKWSTIHDEKSVKEVEDTPGVWQDKPFLLLILIVFLIDLAFVQVFANLPLYYREIHHFSEKTIGLLLALNGVIIFLFEMPLVSIFEYRKINKIIVLLISSLLIGASYLVLNVSIILAIPIIGMVLITLGEMLGFPFSNSFSLDRAPKNRVGQYMGLYTATFSLSHIIAPNIGLRISEHYGFDTTWYVMGVISLFGAGLCIVLIKMLKKDQIK